MNNNYTPVALITGSARRIGAAISRKLHAQGYNLALHYRRSQTDMAQLIAQLHAARPDSCISLQADLNVEESLSTLIPQAISHFGRLDVLINNASAYYPTPFGTITHDQWDELLSSNARAPFLLSQEAAPYLRETHGAIINIADIYGSRPLRGYSAYSVAKAALLMVTQVTAVELGPQVRVNAIAPGNILWSEAEQKAETLDIVTERTALHRQGTPDDIANTVAALLTGSPYITGQVLAVDGGRSLFI